MIVYVLESTSNKLYVGVTGDLARRLREHNRGHCKTSKKIKGDADFTLLHTWEVPDEIEAFKLEKYMHMLQYTSDKAIYDAIQDSPYYDNWLRKEARAVKLNKHDIRFMKTLSLVFNYVPSDRPKPVPLPPKKPKKSLRALLDAKKAEVEGLQKLCTLLGIE